MDDSSDIVSVSGSTVKAEKPGDATLTCSYLWGPKGTQERKVTLTVHVLEEGQVATWQNLKTVFAKGGEARLVGDVTAPGAVTEPLTVAAGTEVILDLNGHSIDRGLAGAQSAAEGGYFADVKGSLTIKDSNENQTGQICGGYSKGPGCIEVNDGGEFILEGGTLTGNKGAYGGGVHIKSGQFIMNGGAITNNSVSSESDGNGGGVFLESSVCSMTMTGGEISGNKAGKNGGGICSSHGKLTISGGTITGNACSVDYDYNYGGGIMCDGEIHISGAPKITGNTGRVTGTETIVDNLRLVGDNGKIVIDGALESDCQIGVNKEMSATSPSVFTSGLKGNGTPAAFSSDNGNYVIASEDTGETTEASITSAMGCWTVTFDPDNSLDPDFKPFVYYVARGSKVIQPAPIIRGNYSYKTWQIRKDGQPVDYDFSEQVEKDITLTAAWKHVMTVTFGPGEGKGEPFEAIGEQNQPIMLPNPAETFSRDGYEAAGWVWTERDISYPGGKEATFYNPGDKVDLTVQWTPVKYDITYDLDGGTLPEDQANPTEYNIESDAITLVNPVKEGSHFLGWTWEGQMEPVKEVTIPAGTMGDLAYKAGFEEHSWSETAEVTKKATASAEGEMVYTCTGCSETKTEAIPKQVLTAKAGKKVYTLKVKKLKKKAQTVKKPVKVTNSAGTKVTYKLASVKKAKFKKKFKVNASNGTITVKKGVKKGTYTVKIKVTTAANDKYAAAAKTVAVKVKVK